VQGTLNEILIDMKGGRFSPGQGYVAISHVKTLQGLCILNFNHTAIKSSDAHNEMVHLKSKLLQSVPNLQCHSFSELYYHSFVKCEITNYKIARHKDSNLKSATILFL